MKKRDFYILGILLCIVIYAASHRKTNPKNNEASSKTIRESQAKIDLQASENDSIESNQNAIIKAGV